MDKSFDPHDFQNHVFLLELQVVDQLSLGNTTTSLGLEITPRFAFK